MTIIKKSELQRHLAEFDVRYQKLKTVVSGSEPNPNIYDQYSNNPDQYRNEFTEVNLIDLEYALNDFNSAIKAFKTIQKLAAPKLARGK